MSTQATLSQADQDLATARDAFMKAAGILLTKARTAWFKGRNVCWMHGQIKRTGDVADVRVTGGGGVVVIVKLGSGRFVSVCEWRLRAA